MKTVALFSVAGFVSAYYFASYHIWLAGLYHALPSTTNPYVDPEVAYHNWYRANIALAQYSTNQWIIFAVGFPIAMTCAIVIARLAGWLGHIHIERMPGLVFTYIAPGFGLFVSALGVPLAIIGIVVAASWLGLSLKIITSRWSKALFLRFLLSGAGCIVILVLLDAILKNEPGYEGAVFVILLQVAWGSIFGMWLSPPPQRAESR